MDKPLGIKRILNPARTMTLTYIISLTLIAGLSIFVHFTLDEIIAEQSTSAKLINISGQQRMLSQRIALYTNEFIANNSSIAKDKALNALNAMQSNHQKLLKAHRVAIAAKQPSPLSSNMYDLYFSAPYNLNQKLITFAALIHQTLNRSITMESIQSQPQQITALPSAKEQILNSFNAVVAQYESESLEKIDELRTTQQLILMVIILTIIVEALFVIRPLAAKTDQYSKNLQEEANHDYLTNLLNRRSFNILAEQSIAMSLRYKTPLSIISFDIDYFKSINDQYGHDLGDKTIQQVASIIKNSCRDSDSVFRFGGEEYLILLPKTSISEAHRLAEKIRLAISDSPISNEKFILEVTASAGVAEWDMQEADIESTLKRADTALYEAKSQGRNMVVFK